MKKMIYLVILGSTLMLQSCFEIIEQVFVKADGSGNFQLVVNLSRSKTKLNSMIKMKTVNGHRVPDKAEITRKVDEIAKTIKGTAGITNVKTSTDFDNYITTLSCDFTKVDNLNAGIKNVSEQENNSKPLQNAYGYDIAGKLFSRVNPTLLNKEYREMTNADKEIFATANYTSIFRFEKEISSASNKESRISANRKAVMVKLNAMDMMRNTKTIENKIKLK